MPAELKIPLLELCALSLNLTILLLELIILLLELGILLLELVILLLELGILSLHVYLQPIYMRKLSNMYSVEPCHSTIIMWVSITSTPTHYPPPVDAFAAAVV